MMRAACLGLGIHQKFQGLSLSFLGHVFSMLDFMRRSVNSIFIKALLGLLIASFAVWGIGDIFRSNSGGETVATVGETNISTARFRADFARELQRVSQVLGQPITREQAVAMGVDAMLLQRLVNTQVLQEGAKELGLVASDAVILNEIKRNDEFFNEAGQFDRRVFVDVLSNAGLNEAMYVALVGENIVRQQFLSPIAAGAVAPAAMVDTLYKRIAETRVLDVVRITHAKVTGQAAPTDAELSSYHEANAQRFMAPEYRALTAVVLSAAELGETIAVSDAELNTAYDERAADYATPEVRSLSQVLVKDEIAAARAAQLLSAGGNVTAVAAEVGANAAMSKLGDFTRLEAAALSAEIAEAAFTTPQGGHSAPVKSPLGWHVLVVDAITKGHMRTLAEVKDELIANIRDERTLDLLFEASNQLEDLLGGGAMLEEAAQNLGVKTVHIAAVDANGITPAGTPVATPYAQELIAEAFKLSEGTDSQMVESADNQAFFVLRVDRVTQPALRPLDTVKKQVVSAWTQEQLSAQADVIAAGVKARLEAGEDAKSIAQSLGFDAFTTAPFNRLGQGLEQGALPATLMEEVFTLNAGDVARAMGTGAHTVARLKSVSDATVDSADPVYAAIHDRALQDLQGDLAAQLSAALQVRHPVSVNQAALNDLTAN